MKPFQTLFFLLAIFAAAACHTAKYTPENFPKDQVRFGSGGGFTGKMTTFVLLKNGQIFQTDSLKGAFTELPKIKKKEAKAFFKATDELELDVLKFNHPGNLYQFIERQTGEKTGRATWGDEKFPPNQKVKDLFIALKALIKDEVKR